MKTAQGSFHFFCFVFVVTFFFATLFWIYPFSNLVWLWFTAAAGTPFFDSVVLTLVGKSLFQSVVSSFLALGFGIVFSIPFCVTSRPARLSPFARFVFQSGFLMPASVAAMVGLTWLGNQYSYNWASVILVQMWMNASWVVLITVDAVGGLPDVERDTVLTLGASPLRSYFVWALPRIAPALFQAFLQILFLCLGSFTIITLMGGGAPVETLETALAWKMRLGVMDRSGSLAIAAWQAVLVTVVFLIHFQFRRKNGRGILRHKPKIQDVLGMSAEGRQLWLQRAVLAIFAISWAPVVVWLFESLKIFLKGGFEPEFALALFQSFGVSLSVSMICVGSTLVWVWLSFLTENLFAKATLWAASGISPMLLAMAWTEAGFEFPSLWAVGMAQGFLFFPFCYRFLDPWVKAKDENLIWVSRSLGASPVRAWFDVEWQRLKRPLFSMITIGAAFSWGETALATWFYQADPVPLALWVSRLAGHYRFEEAQALATLLALMGGLSSFLWVKHSR